MGSLRKRKASSVERRLPLDTTVVTYAAIAGFRARSEGMPIPQRVPIRSGSSREQADVVETQLEGTHSEQLGSSATHCVSTLVRNSVFVVRGSSLVKCPQAPFRSAPRRQLVRRRDLRGPSPSWACAQFAHNFRRNQYVLLRRHGSFVLYNPIPLHSFLSPLHCR